MKNAKHIIILSLVFILGCSCTKENIGFQINSTNATISSGISIMGIDSNIYTPIIGVKKDSIIIYGDTMKAIKFLVKQYMYICSIKDSLEYHIRTSDIDTIHWNFEPSKHIDL